MHVPSRARAHRTTEPLAISISEQYVLADTATGQLAPRRQDLAGPADAAASGPDTTAATPFQAEASVPAQTSLAGLGRALGRRRAELDAAGRQIGISVLPLATFPFETAHQGADDSRLGPAHGADTDVLCGYRIRVRLPRADLAPAVTAGIRPWTPLLLALSANSPWWHGRPSGWASYRAVASGQLELTTQTVSATAGAGCAANAGWVEFPEFDVCLTTDDAVVIAGLARALTVTCLAEAATGSTVPAPAPGFRVDLALEYAARHGTTGVLACPWEQAPRPAESAVRDLLTLTGQALHASGDFEQLALGVERILDCGTGAVWQNQLLSGRGPQAGKLAELAALGATRFTWLTG